MTLTLSELFLPKARRVSNAAANALREGYNASPTSSSIWGPAFRPIAEAARFPSRRHSLATAQAKSLERTSHKPSLARITHSSSSSLSVKVISGSDVTTGFRYLSPVHRNAIENQLFFFYIEEEQYLIKSIIIHIMVHSRCTKCNKSVSKNKKRLWVIKEKFSRQVKLYQRFHLRLDTFTSIVLKWSSNRNLN